jgi:hypothetical protein
MPLRSIGFVASNGLTVVGVDREVVGVVVATGSITNLLGELPDKSVVAADADSAGAVDETALDDALEPVVERVVEPLVVDGEADTCLADARLVGRVVEDVTERSFDAPVVGGLPLTRLGPFAHAAVSTNTPQTATTPRNPMLPMAAAYAKPSAEGTDLHRFTAGHR